MPNAIIEAEGLTKSFGDVHAVTGVDLRVEEGTVFGLLGPNGAGKTTTVRILTTLITPDALSVSLSFNGAVSYCGSLISGPSRSAAGVSLTVVTFGSFPSEILIVVTAK